MKSFRLIFTLFCITFSTVAFSQVPDRERKTIRIPAEPSETKKDSMPEKIKVQPKLEKEEDKSSGEKKEDKRFVMKKSERKPFSMIEKDGLKSSGEIFEKRWNKDLEKGGIIKTMSDQFLGEHRVDTKFVNIICRDHEYADCDRVRIYINKQIVRQSITLTNSYRRIEVDLVQGKNTVEIEALNQGDSGPNTAEFVVYDDKGNLISSKEWNLLTGVKAIIVFNNEKVTIKERSSESNEEDKDEVSNN